MIKELLATIWDEIEKDYRETYGIKGHPDTMEYDQMYSDIENTMTWRCHGDWWKEVDF